MTWSAVADVALWLVGLTVGAAIAVPLLLAVLEPFLGLLARRREEQTAISCAEAVHEACMMAHQELFSATWRPDRGTILSEHCRVTGVWSVTASPWPGDAGVLR